MRTLYFCPVVSSLWSPYGLGQTIIFSSCGFFFFFLFFSSPNLSHRRLDVCHTCTHGVALVPVQDAGLQPAARGSVQMQDAKKSSKICHLGTIPQLCRARGLSSQLRHVSTIGKNLLSSNMSSRCPHNMAYFGPLAAEMGLPVWGTPANFNGFRVLAALGLLHGSQVVIVSQTLRR